MTLKSKFKGKVVLITGNTGFKGSWMTLFLSKLGAVIYGVSLAEKDEDSLTSFASHALAKQFYFDIRDYEKLYDCIKELNPEFIFHLAAKAITLESFEKPLESIQTNVMGTSNLLEVLRVRDKPCRLVVVSSDKCYENKNWIWGYRETDTLAGTDPYSASKSMVELVCRSYYKSFFEQSGKIRMATCRAGNVIGGGDWSKYRIIPDCIRAWRKAQPISIRSPESIRPWNYVLDTVWAYVLTAIYLHRDDVNGEAFNFGPNHYDEITVLQLVEGLWENWPVKEFLPYEIKREMESEEREHKILTLNSDKAHRILHWKTHVPIKKALADTCSWYSAFQEDPSAIQVYSVELVDSFIQCLNSRYED